MNNYIKIILGKVTRELRKAKKMSQEKLAQKSEIHVNTINGLELGTVDVKITTLFFITKGLNIGLDEFMALFLKRYYNN